MQNYGNSGDLLKKNLRAPFILQEAALSHYEKNRRKPDFEVLTRLADIFEVSIDYLIGRTKQSDVVMDEDVRDFVDTLELSDKEVLERFDLMIDGKSLTEEEARRFIAFVRMERKDGLNPKRGPSSREITSLASGLFCVLIPFHSMLVYCVKDACC